MTAVDRYSPNSLKRLMGSLNSVTFRDETGEMEYFGQRVVMLRSETFRLLREELAKRQASGTGNIILGIVGRSVGREEGKALLSYLSHDSATRFSPDFMRRALEETNMGYGKIRLGELDLSARTVTVSTINSFEADPPGGQGETEAAGCFFLLGYLEGLFSELVRAELRGLEASCRSKGDNSCIFRMAASLHNSTKV